MVELTPSRGTEVGGLPVRRALPRRGRRTVGAWCFVDHFGPAGTAQSAAMQVGPHPHIGLQTVTWVTEGEVLHTDSLGSEQLIRPGQLNLMSAGVGIAHAEEARPSTGLHGAQLWVAQPEATRWSTPAFEHHAELPTAEVGAATVTVLMGAQAGVGESLARTDSPLIGLAITARPGDTSLALQPEWEHAVVVLEGRVEVDGTAVEPGLLAVLPLAADGIELRAGAEASLLLLGGEPFEAEPLMWWNFVGRTWEEIDEARADWAGEAPRFGRVRTDLGRIPAPPR